MSRSASRAGNVTGLMLSCIMLMLMLMLMGCHTINKNNAPQSCGIVKLYRVNLKDSVLITTLNRSVKMQKGFYNNDTCLVDFYQSGFDNETYYIEIRGYIPDTTLNNRVGYYTIIQDKYLVLPSSVPKELFEETDEALTINTFSTEEWDSSFPFLHLYYKIGEICNEFMEYSDDGSTFWYI